jgi:hypothetical protein
MFEITGKKNYEGRKFIKNYDKGKGKQFKYEGDNLTIRSI